jgi:hypothetical protein
MANTALFKASMRSDESQIVIDFFKSISYEDAENDENDENAEATKDNDNIIRAWGGVISSFTVHVVHDAPATTARRVLQYTCGTLMACR